MTLKSGTGQACAACKYQRRRCTPECLLAPFFPADQPKMFQNVHRLFGVKNIQNLLKELSPDQKAMAMAMKSLKFHATMRDKYPVYGCLVEIQQLSYQIQMVEEELQAVLHQLAYYRHQQQQELSPTNDYLSELQLGMAPPGNAPLSLVHEDGNPQQYNGVAAVLPQASYSNSCNADYGINYLDFKDNNAVNSLCQQTYSNSNDNNTTNSTVMHPPQLVIPGKLEVMIVWPAVKAARVRVTNSGPSHPFLCKNTSDMYPAPKPTKEVPYTPQGNQRVSLHKRVAPIWLMLLTVVARLSPSFISLPQTTIRS